MLPIAPEQAPKRQQLAPRPLLVEHGRTKDLQGKLHIRTVPKRKQREGVAASLAPFPCVPLVNVYTTSCHIGEEELGETKAYFKGATWKDALNACFPLPSL